MKRFLVLACLFLFLTACGGSANPNPTDTLPYQDGNPDTQQGVNSAQEPLAQQDVVFPTGEFDDPFETFIDPDNLFELTDEQQALFDEYSRDFNFDISVFQGVDPVDVAQVFIECGINGLWEGEYNLFYFEFNPLSKEEFFIAFEHDMSTTDLRTRRSMANVSFRNLNDGTFVDLGDGSGYIEFHSVDSDMVNVFEATLRLNMRLVDDVWMINQSRFLQLAEDDFVPAENDYELDENGNLSEEDYEPE